MEVTDLNITFKRPRFAKVLKRVLSEEECEAWIQRAEEADAWEEALINVGAGRQVSMTDIRNSKRFILDDPFLAKDLFDRIKHELPPTWTHGEDTFHLVGLNERIRFLKYGEGQYFKPHFDGNYVRTIDMGDRFGEVSFVTVLLYPNGGFEGGETTFFPSGSEDGERLPVQPETGLVLVFEHQILHEGSLMGSGTKYSIRTDVMYTRKGPGLEYAPGSFPFPEEEEEEEEEGDELLREERRDRDRSTNYQLSYANITNLKDTRCIAINRKLNLLAYGSMDNSIQTAPLSSFLREEEPDSSCLNTSVPPGSFQGDQWVYALDFLEPGLVDREGLGDGPSFLSGALAVGFRDGSVSVFSPDSFELLVGFPSLHAASISSLHFWGNLHAPFARLLVSGSWDGTVRVTNFLTKECVCILAGHENTATALPLSSGMIVSGSTGMVSGGQLEGQKLRLWSLEGEEEGGERKEEGADDSLSFVVSDVYDELDSSIRCLASIQDVNSVVTFSTEEKAGGEEEEERVGSKEDEDRAANNSIPCSRENSNLVVMGDNDGVLRLFAASKEGGQLCLLKAAQLADSFIFSLEEIPNPQCPSSLLVALACERETVVVDLWQETRLRQLPHMRPAWSLKVDPVTFDILTAGSDGLVRVWTTNEHRWMGEDEKEELKGMLLRQEERRKGTGQNAKWLIETEVGDIPSHQDRQVHVGREPNALCLFKNVLTQKVHVSRWNEQEQVWQEEGALSQPKLRKT